MNNLYESDIESHLIGLLGQQSLSLLEVENGEDMRGEQYTETLSKTRDEFFPKLMSGELNICIDDF